MIAVIFEVYPKEEGKAEYLATAADLRPLLDEVEGFISIERFQSLSQPEKVLSLSFWEDEAAVDRWRIREAHRDAQKRGRSELFADYRLRIAHVIRDYGMANRSQAPSDSRAVHEGRSSDVSM